MWSFGGFLATAVLLSAATAYSKTYRFTHVYGDVKILQDISVNHDDNTVMIAVGDVSRYPGHVSTLNFHDFDTRTTNTTMAFVTKINTDVMNTADVMSVAGKRIVDFCRDYHMYFMTLLPKDLEKPVLESGYPPRSTYDDDAEYPPRSTYDDDAGYPPRSTYDDDAGYAPRSTHDDDAGYPPRSTYDDDAGYPPRSTYDDDAGYPLRSTYDDDAGYPPRSTYDDVAGYPTRSTYDDDAVYPPRSTYDDDAGYPPRSAYDDVAGYPPRSTFDDDAGYPPRSTSEFFIFHILHYGKRKVWKYMY